ncbi:hypothetical protein KIN20_018772 [Parelaphostrongylus tenuis]|uniref:Uncharacterized protein n=1 Tax=Parelaphostrongylus tenuis TaxID=148309 RepID=A0AAD5MK27_PARTN|nr:hypothetical protein KIN20_018772 [Parelaphostrongylus tenuis]
MHKELWRASRCLNEVSKKKQPSRGQVLQTDKDSDAHVNDTLKDAVRMLPSTLRLDSSEWVEELVCDKKAAL